MRRILSMLVVATVMAAMIVVMAAPAMARSFFVPLASGTNHFATKPSGDEIKNTNLIAYPTDPIHPTDPIRGGPCSSGTNPNCVTELPPPSE